MKHGQDKQNKTEYIWRQVNMSYVLSSCNSHYFSNITTIIVHFQKSLHSLTNAAPESCWSINVIHITLHVKVEQQTTAVVQYTETSGSDN